jgi:hypothetical protein
MCKGLLLITLNTHLVGLPWTRDRPVAENCDNTQQTQEIESQAPAGFDPTIPASNRTQTHAVERAATGIGTIKPSSMLASLPVNLIIQYNITQ